MPRLMNRRWFVVLFAFTAVVLIGTALVFRRVLPHLDRRRDPIEQSAAAYAQGDWKRADLLARERLRHAPDDPGGLRLAARAAARQDRDQSAIAIYSRRVVGDMEPEDFYLMGRALSRTGQFEAALKAFETARAGNPDDPNTLDFLCRLYYQTDLYDAAEEAAERLTKQPGWEARAQLMLGTARAELEDPAGVAEALGRWFQLDPEGKAAAPEPVRSGAALVSGISGCSNASVQSKAPVCRRGRDRGSVAVRRDHFVAIDRADGHPVDLRDRALDEAYRAVGEQGVGRDDDVGQRQARRSGPPAIAAVVVGSPLARLDELHALLGDSHDTWKIQTSVVQQQSAIQPHPRNVLPPGTGLELEAANQALDKGDCVGRAVCDRRNRIGGDGQCKLLQWMAKYLAHQSRAARNYFDCEVDFVSDRLR